MKSFGYLSKYLIRLALFGDRRFDQGTANTEMTLVVGYLACIILGKIQLCDEYAIVPWKHL